MASNGTRPKLTQMTNAVGDMSMRHDLLTAEMDKAGAGVQSLLDTTNGQKEMLDQQLADAQKDLERMREVERLIEERRQRARAMHGMQAESRRREQEVGSSRDGMGGATSRQSDTVVLGKSGARCPATDDRGLGIDDRCAPMDDRGPGIVDRWPAPEGRCPDGGQWPSVHHTHFLRVRGEGCASPWTQTRGC